ncbi:MAG TPA: carboxypeptidase-like regulatory domain-containing protein [Planctomycetota bacterium]|nr:carboxypeptidase-like regulatory domain-containing protein [Planctomycetota bacterium]
MKLKVLFGVAGVIAAICFLLPQLGPATTEAVPDAPTTAASVTVAEASRRDAADAATAPQTRTEVPVPPGLVLGGQLVGLHPEVSWTAPIVLRATSRVADAEHEHEAKIAVAADGTFDMVLPAWSRQGTLDLRLEARDPFYLPVDARFGSEVRTREQPISVNVEPTSVVVGKVVDPHGAGVPAARVGAFLPASDRFRGEVFMRCSTNTDANGTYRLQVPMATAVLLLALPMHEASLSGNRLITEDGAITDDNVHRDDLLPSSVRVVTRWGQVTEAPELRLVDPAYVTGSVTTGDGAPLAGVEVIWIHDTADGPALFDRQLGNLMIWSDGTTGRIARARADANGRFRLPATPGKSGACYPLDAQRRREPSVEMQTATPPAELGFRLEGAVALVRVLSGGLPLPGIRVVTDSIADRLTPYDRKRQTDANGEVRFLRSKVASQRFLVERPGDVAREVEIPADASEAKPFVIELPRLPSAPVQLEFDAASRVRQVELTWSRRDAKVLPLQLSRFRNDGEGPFRLDVPEGRYELIVRAPERGERRDTFLLETRYEVEVPMSGRDLKVPIAHGGRIRIVCTDGDGSYAGGLVSITGSAGRFTWVNSWQEPRDSQNVPAGTYELRFDRREQRLHQSTVEVRACEVTEVRVRLP